MKAGCRPILAGLFCALLTVSGYGASPGYKFTILAQTGDTIAGKTLTSVASPLINNTGTIVFSGSFAGGSGIFTPTDLLVQTGDTIAGKTLTALREFRLNDGGTLAFLGSFAGGSAIFTPSGLLVQTGDVIAGKMLTGFQYSVAALGGVPFAINNAGTLVFAADCQPGATFPSGQQLPSGVGIFTTSELLALTQDVRADLMGPFGNVDQVYSPNINNIGSIVFGGSTLGNTFNIYTPTGLLAVSAPDQAFDYPVINDSGTIVFFSEYGGGAANVTTIRTPSEILAFASTPGGSQQSGSIGGQTLCGVLPRPTMNTAGTVVFGAVFQDPNPPRNCSFTGLATISEVLVEAGDTIGSKTLAFGLVLSPSINDAGTIVFFAPFTDGSSAIVMATPINSIEGDVNGDGIVDCADLDLIRAELGRSYGQAGFNPRADVNGDGVIDVRDLAFVAQNISTGVSCR